MPSKESDNPITAIITIITVELKSSGVKLLKRYIAEKKRVKVIRFGKRNISLILKEYL